MPFGPGNQYRWQPGKSGNPKGRTSIPEEVRELAEADSPEAYLVVAELMRGSKTTDSVRFAAAIAILKMAGVPMNATVNVNVNHQQQQSEAAQVAPTPHLEDGLGPSGAQA